MLNMFTCLWVSARDFVLIDGIVPIDFGGGFLVRCCVVVGASMGVGF